ncbi:MAG TPA: Holliday junction ATP-dependent DNA helicase RuvA [Thermotogota bacterium]|jgi:Holliday junction DNA helicase RuvA|nr:Holliday junction branch migration protein RuvA [Thermotogota bacterium]NLH18712.1 Holliday junction branch migration protein RuvA [Thermotogaceae bacterium]OQC31344.1 MAG: Holliday junction ATP-dependent DNA helicase RuvA [Thermotogota bacterium ADurb.Bin062]HNW46932.1 Holliday junction ATP-dependent DNA helicase RuvA [Thermotogota bacterium]HNY81367.1 Holliday junction ATP-dependent DNA helicase RuvA [Thermotogota bacterium]
MIHSIKGKIVERIEGGLIILENHDIGFEIWADKELYDTGDVEVKAFVIFQPSESEWRMYGFLKREKRAFFQLLTTVNGLGAKTAMKILYDASVREIARSILENDLTYLSTLPNVGKKTAERIVLELKSKVKQVLPLLEETQAEGDALDLSLFQQATEALEALGYSPVQSRRVLRELFSEKKQWGMEELIKAALKKFFEK